mgnify:CR=1 FL=1
METILEAKNLSKEYFKTTGFFSRNRTSIKALDNISISIKKGITLAVVGESGSGKSTLAKSLIRLIELDKGSITFKNRNMRTINGIDLKKTRKNIQMIFQDPYASLNPRMKIIRIMEEPLKIHGMGDNASQYSKILSMIKKVGLVEADLSKYPHQFSGGQRQRIGIARALYNNAEIIIFDEATSSLDTETERVVMESINSLSKNLTILIIAHRITTLKNCDVIISLEDGNITSTGSYNEIN